MRYEAGFLARAAAQRYSQRPAITYGGATKTFQDLNETANRIGSGLQAAGLQRGDRVALLAVNRPEVVQTWIACEKFALVRVALHAHSPMSDHVALLNHVGAKALIFDAHFASEVDAHRSEFTSVQSFVALDEDCPDWATPLRQVQASGSTEDPYLDVDEDEPCFLQLTSGTTGVSKPWIKTYRSWLAVINQNAIHLDTLDVGTPVDASDVNLHFHPLQWASGFQTLYPYLIRGARTVIMPDDPFDAEAVIDVIVSEKVTGTFAPGPLLSPILDAVEARGGIDHSLKRVVVFFGNPDLLERTSVLLGPIWAHGFGSTEQGAVTTRLLPSEVRAVPERMNSVGRPASPNIEIAIMSPQGQRLPAAAVGEIAVRSAMSQGEYWGMNERTAAAYFDADWFRSGDIGYLDGDGFLFYADRAGDTIQVDGSVIYPHTVEAALLAHPAVSNCGVVGLERHDGTEVVGALVLKPGFSPSDMLLAEVLALATANLPPGNAPHRLVVVEELPTVLGGAKVQRSVLREQLQQQ